MNKPSRPGSRASSLTPSGNPAGPATRKNRSQATGLLTREDAVAKAPGDLKTPAKAMAYLSDHGYAPEGAQLSLHTVAFILFQLAAASHSATDSDGIKAVGFLLEELGAHDMAATLADRITEKIEAKIDDVAQAMNEAKEKELEFFKDAGRSQQKALKAIRNEVGEAANLLAQNKADIEGVHNGLENAVGEAAEFFQTSLSKISEQVLSITSTEQHDNSAPPIRTPASTIPSQTQPTDSFSYAQVTGQHLPSTHASNINRNSDKHRQFTIQPASREDDMGLDALSELEIIAKLKLAYETMTVGKDTAPTELRFTSVRRMKRGGILFDLNSDEAADWLRADEAQKDFTRHFSATAVVQGYQFRVLAEFVPISFDAESPHAAAGIEEANYLPAGSIAEVGWVKRADRRSATQQVAHLKISFTRIDQANDAIEKGLAIQGKGVNVRQMIVEPQRCAKCQLYGHDNNKGAPHFAKNCAWTHDVCGLCSEMHRTSDCKANMPGNAQCANCKLGGREYRGHTVHSRNCPTFIEIKARYDQRSGSQQYRFFVTEDTRTWETSQPTIPTFNAAQPMTQATQHYPTPPPNQLQQAAYSRPPPGPSGPPRQHPQRHIRGGGPRPRGIQLSAANSTAKRQGTLNRWMAIATAINEDDDVDAEIEATNALITTGRLTTNPAQEGTADWADDGRKELPSPTFRTTPPLSLPTTPTATPRSATTSQDLLGSSPLRFPTPTPAPAKTVSQ